MAGGAIGQFLLADAFFQMLAFGFGRVVFMAVVAGVLRVSGCVAGFAGNFALFAMIERENVLGEFGPAARQRPYDNWRNPIQTTRHEWSVLHGRPYIRRMCP